MQLTQHFNLTEFTRSQKALELGISNEPGPTHLRNLQLLAEHLEKVRALLGQPMDISSAYRSPPLNVAVGGSSTSDHANGLAADFTSKRFGSVRLVCEAIATSPLHFDQLIYEQEYNGVQWVHIGFGHRMRRQVMSWSPARKYVNGLVDLGR